MEHFSSAMDLPVSEMQMKMKSQYFTVSNEQMIMVEPVSSNPEFEHFIPHNQVGHITESSGGSVSSNPMWNQFGREDANILNQGNSSLPVKRKAEVGSLSNNSISQPWLLPSKRPAHMEAGSSFQQSSATERKSGQAYSKSGSQGLQAQSLLNKKMNRNESMPSKSGIQRGQSAKKQVTQIGAASKARPESSGAVRSKMRESLAAALALAFPKTDDVSNPEKDQIIATTADLVPADSQASGPNSTAGGLVPGSDKMFHPNESALIGKTNDFQVSSAELPSNESSANGDRIFQEFQYSLPDEDASFSNQFFTKDDLLHVNGLSWAFEFDEQMMQGKEAQDAGTPHSVNVKQEDPGHKDSKVDQNLTPENLASEIEAELYKLHGGVNKKYKEKGRSLLFNLKDRSNPELRERVMSGEISPERLCSMSAEELASKELSQWRMAKAEEFAQMVVLPDTDVDIRRLVRKTHKGEFQVEVEHDDGIVAEVSGGTSMLTRPLPQKEKPETHYSPKASTKDTENIAGQENIVENQEFSGSLIIPTDGTDLMQGIIVDELKDPNFLPPIVSLDEFMESLDAEPPFPNLSADSGVKTPLSDDRSPKALNKTRASDRASDSPREAPSKKGDGKKSEVLPMMKLSGSPTMQKVLPSTSSKAAYIWEGNLELTMSSSITVSGLFQSGEKTSTKEWPKSLEIKGRVRLDAFEKFLQELPKSRTRAVMVLEFVLKDKSSETERSKFAEAVDSFAEDERLGYAEPVSAVELYLCPPTQRITDILKKLMAKERPEANNSIENGLIGVVVWRRAHISNRISPNSSSHHKHSTKKQQFAPPKRVQDSSNVKANNTPSRTPLPRVPQPQPVPDEDDDVPPGFGPAANAAKDDDDLPEFNFSGDINPSASKIPYHARAPQRPVDKVRELIQKYGQSGTSPTPSVVDSRTLGGIVPWNDDDDDDIPEWRPQAAPPQLHHQSYPMVPGHLPPPPTNQHMAQTPLRGVVQPPLGGRWAQPPGPLHGTRWRHH